MPSLGLLIYGVDRTPNVHYPSGVSLGWRLGGRGSARFTLESLDGSYTPEIGHDVQWFDALGTKIWGGVIHTISPKAAYKSTVSGTPLFTACDCVTYEQSLDKRIITIAVYENKTCKEILDDIFNVQLPENGNIDINYGFGTINNGATIDRYVIDHQRVSDILTDLATRSGYTWWVGVDRDLYFVPRATSPATHPAPFSITDADPNCLELSIKKSIDGYRNRQYIRISYEAFGPETQTIVGDGATKSWTLYDWSRSPAIPSLVNYIESIKIATGSPASEIDASWGTDGIDTGKQFYFKKGSSTLRQDAGETALTTDQQLTVVWRQLGGDVVWFEDGVEVALRAFIEGTTGVYAHVLDNSSEIDAVGHYEKAQAIIAAKAAIGTEVNGITDETGLAPGQVLDINVSVPSFNGSVLIDQVDAEMLTGTTLRYAFHGSTTAYDDWVAKWDTVLAGGGSGNTVVAAVSTSEGTSTDDGLVTINGSPVTY